MWRLIDSVIDMLVYSAVYIVVALVSLKIVGATITADFEKKVSEDGNVGLSIICASIFLGLAILLSMLVR
jgi:uncharacterized membrane protein YjfL (UPF0719 family)